MRAFALPTDRPYLARSTDQNENCPCCRTEGGREGQSLGATGLGNTDLPFPTSFEGGATRSTTVRVESEVREESYSSSFFFSVLKRAYMDVCW